MASRQIRSTKSVKWAAVVAAVLLLGGLLCGGIALFLGSWSLLAFAGIIEGAGIGFAVLNTSDDRG